MLNTDEETFSELEDRAKEIFNSMNKMRLKKMYMMLRQMQITVRKFNIYLMVSPG